MQRYNGQLINQFPNTINGNAAAGAQITVRVKSSGAFASLYATDSLSGGTLDNPLTADAKGYYGFYAPDGVYTLDVNIAGTPQLEIQLQDVASLKAQFDNAVLNAGYIPVGTFAAGCTVSQANGVVSDGSSYWRWDGALPKTVTAGSAPVPAGVSGWVLVSDFALRNELAATDSTVLVGGVEAVELADRFFESAITYTVGTGGDYPNIKSALIALDKKRKLYTTNAQYHVTLNLLSGFVMAEQIMLYGGIDLSWVKITSEGRTVVVNTASMTQYLSSEEVPLFSASSESKLPYLSNIVFSPNNTGSGDPQHSLRSCICVRQNSSAMLDALTIQDFQGKGILGEYNAVIEARTITCKNNGENLRLRHGSRFHGRSNDSPETTWDFTGGATHGINIAIDSVAYIRKVDVSNSGIGLYLSDLAATFSCAEITSTGCTASDLSIDGGSFNSETSATFGNVILRRGANVKCNTLNITGALFEVNSDSNVMVYGAYTGAIVSVVSGEFFATDFNVTGKTGSGVTVSQGGTFTCIGTMVSKSNTVNGVLVTIGGIANIQANADLTLNGGSGARANGGTINLGSNANCRKNGTTDQTQDIRVSLGGVIRAVGALGGVFTTANTLTVDGIIFK